MTIEQFNKADGLISEKRNLERNIAAWENATQFRGEIKIGEDDGPAEIPDKVYIDFDFVKGRVLFNLKERLLLVNKQFSEI